ncbi:hypothetical protein KC332_g5171 [Hortaea werneckii]|nr:hypothetical protein KC350_g9103 [Hortaea werneckii]KAI6837528.1 hypothetical protein KC358_g5092 [Hortaea werneckii]KAI6938452.1 hypothetical protein KC341_g4897 [Hortaea werneckii]KAI6939290.1 hypothetical protein KC348_g5291 [Hortaea werneckii]KAI6973983.1 hypothetical protein KC321_g5358 [Hortaea werneckii]
MEKEMTTSDTYSFEALKAIINKADTKTLLKLRDHVRELSYTRLSDDNRTNSPLLRLPPELRDRILEYALQDRWPVEIPCRDDPKAHKKKGIKPYKPPALLSVSRQLRTEGRPIYYSGNIFDLSSDTLKAWLLAMPLQQRKLINAIRCTPSLRIHWWESDLSTAVQVIGQLEKDVGLTKGCIWAEVGFADCAGGRMYINSAEALNDFEELY